MKLSKLLIFLFCIHLFGWNSQLVAQQSAYPYIQNYKSNIYEGHAQVSCIVRGEDGLVYIGTEPGVGVYNGVEWRWLQVSDSKGQGVRSLAKGADGKIYVGSSGEFGYLKVDEQGKLAYQSLLNKVPKDQQQFSLVWSIVSTSEGVYFRTSNTIFRWDFTQQKMKYWSKGTGGAFQSSAVINNQFYVRQWEVGLLKIKNDRLELLPNGDFLANERIYTLLPYDDEQLLIGTRQQGFLLYNGQDFSSFPTEADDLLKKAPIYLPGAKMGEDQFIFGTLGAGVVLIDKKGKLILHLNKEKGLTADNIFYHYLDHENILWLSTADGVSMVALNDPLRFYDTRSGVEGGVFSIQEHGGQLYIGTEGGVAYFDSTSMQFKLVENSGVQAFQLKSTDKGLFAVTNEGLQIIQAGKLSKVPTLEKWRSAALSFHFSQLDSNLIFLGTFNGFKIVKKQSNGIWKEIEIIEEIEQPIYWIAEDQTNDLWLTTRDASVLRVRFPSFPDLEEIIVTKIDSTYNLPKDAYVDIVNNMLYGFSYEGIFKWKSKQQKFIQQDDHQTAFQVDQSGGKWNIQYNKRGLTYTPALKNNSMDTVSKAIIFGTLQDILIYYGSIFQAKKDAPIWIGSADGLINYDPTKQNVQTKNATNVLFSRVTIKGDTTIYSGLESNIDNDYILDFDQNQILLEFASPSFPKENRVEYSSRLEDFEEVWTPWNTRNSRGFTNLSPGEYSFQVKSKNAYGIESSVSQFYFKVNAPWWQTAWFFLIYALLLALGIYGIILLVRRNTNKKLAYQSALQYKEINELKTRFYTNITHEFRTPLTVILGMAQEEKDFNKARNLIVRNGQKLLQLVNQLLDLSKIDTGHLQANYQQIEIVSFTQYIGESFQSLADKKYIRLNIYAESNECWMDMDEEKYRQIISNLLTNAIKFTPESGKIVLHLSQQNQRLQIKIKDNGMGIPSTELPYIFDRFYQVDNTESKQGQGTGVGLALVKELVELMDGKIVAESTERVGTLFSIHFPIRRTAHRQLTTFEEVILDRTLVDHEELIISPSSEDLPHLLIIEDNPDVVIYIQSILQNQYELSIAKNGEQGIEKAIEQTPDIIISDVMMPKKNGFEVVETLKKDIRTSHIPIILLTAKATQEYKVEGLKYGADAYLMKPFDKEELFIRLKKLIEVRKQLQQKYANYQPSDAFQVSDASASMSIEEQFLFQVHQQIEENYTHPDFNVDALARLLGMSRMQLYRKLKAVSNQTGAQLIRDIRLEKAKILLKNQQLNISEIAYELGYNDPNYFIRQFRKAFHKSPNIYRKSL